MNAGTSTFDVKLARRLILDELFDLSLYRALHRIATGGLRRMLETLIPIEQRHFTFWQDFFGVRAERLDLGRRIKLALIVLMCRVFGAAAIHLVLEAIEVHGVRKYLDVWERYRDERMAAALRDVLEDEFKHEDATVAGDEARRINPERIRNIFLGLNDGLVEIVGAVSGFFAAFDSQVTVLMAAVTVAVAGAFSMAAGAYVATSSESEVRATERARQRFLVAASPAEADNGGAPLGAAILVGLSYLAGALVPVAPVLFGAHTAWPSLLTAGAVVVLVSMLLAFLSGMNVRRRIVMNLVIITAAVAVTYAIGIATKALFGIAV